MRKGGTEGKVTKLKETGKEKKRMGEKKGKDSRKER
jgi:hypothetical protein